MPETQELQVSSQEPAGLVQASALVQVSLAQESQGRGQLGLPTVSRPALSSLESPFAASLKAYQDSRLHLEQQVELKQLAYLTQRDSPWKEQFPELLLAEL